MTREKAPAIILTVKTRNQIIYGAARENNSYFMRILYMLFTFSGLPLMLELLSQVS